MKKLLFLLFIVSGCQNEPLSVYTEGFNAENLASYYVKTPDLRRLCPSIGQRLVLHWNCAEATHICLTVRTRDCEEKTVEVPIDCPSGTYIYTLADQDYLCSGGILTYTATLYSGDEPCYHTEHHLWTELICIVHEE